MFKPRQTSSPSKDVAGGEAGERSKCKSKFVIRIITRGAVIRLGILAAFLIILCLWGYFTMVKMPGRSYAGPLPSLTDAEVSVREELVRDVNKLASEIGERNILHYQNLTAAADFIKTTLTEAGYEVSEQNSPVEGKDCCNITAEILGAEQPEEIVVVGAHYDSVYGSAGANDNISGVAATLALARYFYGKKVSRTLRLVLFVNEEPLFSKPARWAAWFMQKAAGKKARTLLPCLALRLSVIIQTSQRAKNIHFPLILYIPQPATSSVL